MEEYVASTREPVGSRNAFEETPSRSNQSLGMRADAGGRGSSEPSAIAIYLVCIAALLVAALAYVLTTAR